MLLVIVLLTAILSISIGVFNIILGQILISGELGDSPKAMLAADQAIERGLYIDRVLGPPASTLNEDSISTLGINGGAVSNAANACYTMKIDKTADCGGTGTITCITATGQYKRGVDNCNVSQARDVRRSFKVIY